jgi:hypothetical protein
MLGTLRQLANANVMAACHLNWFIDRHMQQYLKLCAGARVISAMLEFWAMRQQRWRTVFHFSRVQVPDRATGPTKRALQLNDARPILCWSSQQGRLTLHDDGRRGKPAMQFFAEDTNDVWPVFLDLLRLGPIQTLCCPRYVAKSCFLGDSHVALSSEKVKSMKQWKEQL